jgi:hypothetical protein
MPSLNKPLVRWTVGPANSRFDDAILRRSILNFRKIYGDAFDCVLCVNGRDGGDLESLGSRIVRQTAIAGMPRPQGVAWKLYPPRLRPEAHELFIDHDVVFVDRLPKVDQFLSMDDAFIYSRSFSVEGCYGSFRDAVPDGFRLNSGFFGVPPGFVFDFSSVDEWRDYFDEQGFVASCLCSQKHLIEVGLEEIHICIGDERPRSPGAYHFVHGDRDERWARFVRSTTI